MDLALEVGRWISVLLLTFLFTVVERLVTSYPLKRSHHVTKTTQECLVGHQFSYFTFFLIAVATIGFEHKSLLSRLLALCGMLAMTFWLVGLRILYKQEDKIGHGCERDETCARPLPADFLRANEWLAAVMAVLTLGLIVALSYSKPGAAP